MRVWVGFRGVSLPAVIAAALLFSACGARTTGVSDVTASSAKLHAKAQCDKGQSCTWYWEYWPASQPRTSSTKTAVSGPAGATPREVPLTAQITGLQPGSAYRWVFCGSPNAGGFYACAGPKGQFDSPTADPPSDYATFTTAAGWTLQSIPSPFGQSVLQGVSCASPTACIAVGGVVHTSGGAEQALAEYWDGTDWTLQQPPTPAGATYSFLTGVSCTSASSCTAVGIYANSATNSMTLAEHWDGTTWTIQPTPNPTGATASVLEAVSCISATSCTAVGQLNTGTFTTPAEHWDGTTWTIQPTPSPVGSPQPTTLGVSCTSAMTCNAVWSYTNSAGVQLPVAEGWDGTAWTIESVPVPSTAQSSSLIGLSCTSATACIAVGGYSVKSGGGPGSLRPLAERWNGTSWTIQAPPNPSGASFSGVSCASATACTAAGAQSNSAGDALSLAEQWNGNTWTVQTTPNQSGGTFFNNLLGISCPSVVACTAVGDYGDNTGTESLLAESYSG